MSAVTTELLQKWSPEPDRAVPGAYTPQSLPVRDWFRIWATLPPRNLPPALASDLQSSIASRCIESFISIAVLAACSLVIVISTVIDLSAPTGQLWTAIHVSEYVLVAAAVWSLRKHQRLETLTARRVNYTMLVPVICAGLLWGTLPLAVGNNRPEDFLIATNVAAVYCVVGFFWTRGHWPLSMTFATLIVGGLVTTFWVHGHSSAGVLTVMGVLLLGGLLVLSLLVGYAMVRSHSVETRARRRSAEAKLANDRLDTMVALTSGLAHDFNNQLATVMGAVELASRDPALDGRPNHYLDRAMDACLRSSRITADLVVASGNDAVYDPAPFDATAVLNQIATDLSHSFASVAIRVEASRSVWIHADQSHFMRAVHNLIQNACQAITEAGIDDGEVVATCAMQSTSAGAVAAIEIIDNGPGVDPEFAKRIFEPFTTSRRRAGGTGLGLSVAQGFARHAGGSLTMTPNNPGATFTLTIPVAEHETRPTELASPTDAASPQSVALSGRFLIVEDDATIAENLHSWIETMGGTAQTAATVAEAMDLCAEYDGELAGVICDIVLPDGEGFEVVAALRNRDPRLCSVYMSGRIRSLPPSAGVRFRDPLLTKPFSFAELVTALEAAGIPVRR